MTVVVNPFRAVRPAFGGEVTLEGFLSSAAPDDNLPNAPRLLTSDRRPTDRSRFVAHMRAAAMLAQWRRDERVVEDSAEGFYTWEGPGGRALAGLAPLGAMPATAAPDERRDAKALLEATGSLLSLPCLHGFGLPVLEAETVGEGAEGRLGYARSSMPIRLETDQAELSRGAASAAALRALMPDGRVPAWLCEGRECPPDGLLFWSWTTAQREADR